MLIGASSSAIQLIKDLGNFNDSNSNEEFSHIEIPNIKIPKIEIPKIEFPSINFSKLVTKAHKAIDKIEQDDLEINEDLDEPAVTKEKNENSENIINSLFSQQEENLVENDSAIDTKSEHTVDPDDYALYKKYLS